MQDAWENTKEDTSCLNIHRLTPERERLTCENVRTLRDKLSDSERESRRLFFVASFAMLRPGRGRSAHWDKDNICRAYFPWRIGPCLSSLQGRTRGLALLQRGMKCCCFKCRNRHAAPPKAQRGSQYRQMWDSVTPNLTSSSPSRSQAASATTCHCHGQEQLLPARLVYFWNIVSAREVICWRVFCCR